VVLDAVATLDLGEFRRRYRADGHGRTAFDPEMMVALVLYGYCQGERSSRVIEKRCVRDVGYRVITGGLRTDHATIARFRAQDVEAEARQLGLAPEEIGPYLGRPASSVAKPIDEWLYATITGGLPAASR
jgi:hypothetical protein